MIEAVPALQPIMAEGPKVLDASALQLEVIGLYYALTGVAGTFTAAEIAETYSVGKNQAGRYVQTLRDLGLVEKVGKRLQIATRSAVVRVPGLQPSATPKRALSVTGLSLRARGLYAVLRNLRGGNVAARGLYEHLAHGRNAVRGAMRELAEAGLVKRRRVQHEGRWMDQTNLVNTGHLEPRLRPEIGEETGGLRPEIGEEPVVPLSGATTRVRAQCSNTRTSTSTSSSRFALGDRDPEEATVPYPFYDQPTASKRLPRSQKESSAWTTTDLVAEFFELGAARWPGAPIGSRKDVTILFGAMLKRNTPDPAVVRRAMEMFWSDPALYGTAKDRHWAHKRFLKHWPNLYDRVMAEREVQSYDYTPPANQQSRREELMALAEERRAKMEEKE